MSDTTVPQWTLGWRLQRSLAHAGISVEQMAAELGVTRQTIGRWMHERGEPKLGYLRLWAMRTGVPLGWLLEGVSAQPSSGVGVRKAPSRTLSLGVAA